MQTYLVRSAVLCAMAAALAACGGSGSSGSSNSGTSSSGGPNGSSTQSGTVAMMVSDASADDWACIGVQVISIALIPQAGGANVTVYTAPTSDPYINLEQLDQLAELLGNVSVPVGTYTGAVVTVGGNPGDVMLTASANPEAGFSLAGGTVVASADIQIQGTTGTSPNKVVPITVNFVSPLVVTTAQNHALDLEFDLSHPAFIVGHLPPAATSTQWAVNFGGPAVRHHPIADITRLVLRHMYGTVTAISSDNTSISMSKDFATLPVATPETAVASSEILTIQADATNGTLYYDVDAGTTTKIISFAGLSLDGEYVRVAARYQQDGSLVATRIWASSSFQKVWLSPEGHVLHANATTDIITIDNESGVGVPMLVNADTQFYLRRPSSASADATAIGSGPSFLASGNLVRGFKVHASAVYPLTTPMVAQSIDIETAAYSGTISLAGTSSFTYTHNYLVATDDYSVALNYIASASANNYGSNGVAVTGYDWWNFAYPTVLNTGSSGISAFVTATDGTVTFGGTAAPINAWGVSYAQWEDPSNAAGWSAAATILEPVPVPAVTVATALAAAASGYAFTVNAVGGTQPVTVDVSNTKGAATLVYQIDYSTGVVTVSSIDITSSTGLTTLMSGLAAGTKVSIAGVPQSDGTLKAYVLTYFTNTTPAD
jgi:hypothetical protein